MRYMMLAVLAISISACGDDDDNSDNECPVGMPAPCEGGDMVGHTDAQGCVIAVCECPAGSTLDAENNSCEATPCEPACNTGFFCDVDTCAECPIGVPAPCDGGDMVPHTDARGCVTSVCQCPEGTTFNAENNSCE